MHTAVCPKCKRTIWVPSYEGDGAPVHYCTPEDTTKHLRTQPNGK